MPNPEASKFSVPSIPFFRISTSTTTLQPGRILQLQTLLESLQTMITQQTIPSILISAASVLRPQFTMPEFPFPYFPFNVVAGDVLSQSNLPLTQTQTIHDLVNQSLAQMTLSTCVLNGG